MDTPRNLTRQSVGWRSGLSGALYLGLGVPLLLIGAVALSGLVPRGHALAAAARITIRILEIVIDDSLRRSPAFTPRLVLRR